MKKTSSIIRIMAIALVAIMMLGGMAACAKKSDAKLILGKWETDLDLGKSLKDQMAASEGEQGEEGEEGEDIGLDMSEFMKDIDFDKMKMKCYFEFKDDGTYTMTPDDESFKVTMKEFLRSMMKPLMAMFGGEATDEAILEMLEAKDWDEAIENFKQTEEGSDMNAKGTYEIKDGKLYLTDADDKDGKAQEFKYSINGSELKIELSENAEGTENLDKSFFPLVLKKAGK